MKTKGVIWITGLSGSGKTTVSKILQSRLVDKYGIYPVLLDGDRLRSIYPIQLGYSYEDRRRLAASYGRLSMEIANQGHLVICSTISLFREIHLWNRENIPGYVEVLLQVPLNELIVRDNKGVYAQKRELDLVVGIEIAVEFPQSPDLIINNYGAMSPQNTVDEIINFLNKEKK